VTAQMMWILTVVAVIAVVAAFLLTRRKRTERLRARFGPEYDRVVRESGNVAKAEASLASRAARVERLHIRPLTAADATRFAAAWRDIQTLFVDDPKNAVLRADRLVSEVMHARGYPVGDFDQRIEDISVDHPNVVMNYRAARDIVRDHERGSASTEDLRQAMVHYRALFTDLLASAEAAEPNREPVAQRGR
jgi:hypothetical protein